MGNSGLAFHCHHDRLFEYVYDYQGRVKYIEFHKSKREQELRLRLFKLIPADRLPKDLVKARATLVKARATLVKAEATLVKAEATLVKAEATRDKARVTARVTWDKWVKALNKHTAFLIQLHAELCPDCPFDGKTIFGGRRRWQLKQKPH